MISIIKDFVENNPEDINYDIVHSWNEVNEALYSLENLSAVELEECYDSILQRLRDTQNYLSKYVSDEEVLKIN